MKYALLSPDRTPEERARAWLAVARQRLPEVVWRAMHPLSREAFVAGPAPAPLRGLRWEAGDGWEGRLGVAAAAPGGSGEPLLLLPTAGLAADVFRCGGGVSLVDRLTAAGFTVYLGASRLSVRGVWGPQGAPRSFDDAVERDLPAMVEALLEDSGYPRVHLVGHGLGGQLGLAWVAQQAGRQLASLALLGTPVRMPRLPPGWAALAELAAAWAPAGVRLPTRRLGRWRAPFVGDGDAGRAAGRRAMWTHVADDLPLSVVREALGWLREGALVDRDGQREVVEALARIREPLWLGVGQGDQWCPSTWSLPLREAWQGGGVTLHRFPEAFDHLDPVLHPEAGTTVHEGLVAWLVRHRVRAWREATADPEHPLGASGRLRP